MLSSRNRRQLISGTSHAGGLQRHRAGFYRARSRLSASRRPGRLTGKNLPTQRKPEDWHGQPDSELSIGFRCLSTTTR